MVNELLPSLRQHTRTLKVNYHKQQLFLGRISFEKWLKSIDPGILEIKNHELIFKINPTKVQCVVNICLSLRLPANKSSLLSNSWLYLSRQSLGNDRKWKITPKKTVACITNYFKPLQLSNVSTQAPVIHTYNCSRTLIPLYMTPAMNGTSLYYV